MQRVSSCSCVCNQASTANLSAAARAETPLGIPSRVLDDPYHGTRPRVTFARDGSFRLLVLSDLHLGERDRAVEKDARTVSLMRQVLHDETPDYVHVCAVLSSGLCLRAPQRDQRRPAHWRWQAARSGASER